MADLTTQCASFVENPETDEMRISDSLGITAPIKRMYLDDELFPDISLVELSPDEHSTEELFQLNTTPISPLAATTPFRIPGRLIEVAHNNSKLIPSLLPSMDVKANGSQTLNSDVKPSFWLRDECLPDITNYSFDSMMQQSINFSMNITASDMERLNCAQKATIESNLEHVATSPLTASPISFPQNKGQGLSTSTDKDPTLGCGPPEQDGLPTTSMTSDESTITRSSDDGRHNTFDAAPLSPANGTMSESNSSVSHHNILEAKSRPLANETIILSDSSPSDLQRDTSDANCPAPAVDTESESGFRERPNVTFNASLLAQSNIALEKGSSNNPHNTFDADPKSNRTILLENISSDRQYITFDPSLLSQANITSEEGYIDNPHDTFDVANGTMSKSSSSGSHQNILEAKSHPPANETIILPDSSPSDLQRDTADVNHPAPAVDAESESVSRERHHGTFDVSLLSQSNIPSEKDSANNPHNTFDADPKSDRTIQLGNFSSDRSFHTSTPLSCKMDFFNVGVDLTKSLVTEEKPDGDTASKPEVRETPVVISSDVCRPKISQAQPAAKSLLPCLKASSQLPKFKPLLQKRGKTLTSGLPVKQSVPSHTLKENLAVPRATSSSHVTPMPRPKTGAEKTQIARKPPSIPKVLPPPRTQLTRSSTLTSSTASNPAVTLPQTRKRDISREAQLTQTKKIKTDTAVSAAAGEAVSRSKNIKPPVKHQISQSGCQTCIVLKAENQRLKEELQKYKREDK
ncbi:uncharacterized protein LOC133171381 isoform X2 [Syngnathus typhle]|uniref:uncharacterized protein LOC133171381 isoform X2 n=1 Tax=Syngnathus typhle TaxID=161592 RepID=UPI002A6A0F73|nr:uncharacterized protein LOC133171381 isoform X2 [Syngnathus typhle]